jgi:hypothetical protein
VLTKVSTSRATAIIVAYATVAATVVASVRSPFAAYGALILGAVIVAVLSESFRTYRLQDDVVEMRSLLTTRRIPVRDITEATLRSDGWGSTALVVRGRHSGDFIVIPTARFGMGDSEARAVVDRVRGTAGARIDPAVLAL